MSQPEDPGAGQNPESGASIHYYLGEDIAGDVSLEILDGSGEVVNRVGGVSDAPGLHRVHWDFRYESSATPRMRTKVLEHSHVQLGDDGWRPAGDGGRVTPLAPPGDYTIRMRVGDEESSVLLEVLKDPVSTGTESDIRAQFEVILN